MRVAFTGIAFVFVLALAGCGADDVAPAGSPRSVTRVVIAPPPSITAAAGTVAHSPDHTAAGSSSGGWAGASSAAPSGMGIGSSPGGALAGAPAPVSPPTPPPVKPTAAGAPAPPSAGSSAAPGPGGGTPADAFCDKYEQHCGFAKPQRHADRATCVQDYNATPIQQGCKNMHMNTAIAGTAAGCSGTPPEFCFSIHCLHVAALPDQTGTTYCK